MKLRFAPRGIIEIDEARIIFRNFSGRGDKYNREGDRNFAVVIETQEMCDALLDEGWNVRVRPSSENEDETFMYLPVKIKFSDRGPACFLKSGHSKVRLDENSIGCLDKIDIAYVDLDIRPYDWDINGKSGRTAYLQAIHVTQDVDRFTARYAEEEHPEEVPFN